MAKVSKKQIENRLKDMQIALETDEVYKQLTDEYTWYMLAKGEVPQELAKKIHDHLQMKFPVIKKTRRKAIES